MKYMALLALLVSHAAFAGIPEDKQLHLGVSTVLGFSTTLVIEDPVHAYAACMSVGLAKELYDQYDYGGFSTGDLAYDALGCALGSFIGYPIKVYSERDVNYIGVSMKL